MAFPAPVRVTCEGDTFDLLTGAATTRDTAGANPRILTGGILRQICVELANSSPPLHVAVHIVHEANVIELGSAWVRGPSDHGGAGGLVWNGDQPIGENASLFIFAQNDTGATVTVNLHWNVEKRT